MGMVLPDTATFTSTSTPSSLPSSWDWSPSCRGPESRELAAVSEPLADSSEPSADAVDERLPDDELLERLLELDDDGMPGRELLEEEELEGIEGMDAVEEEVLDGRPDDEEGEDDELGIDGEEEEEDDEDEELGMEGMPLLLLELCWVDSQPASARASTEAPI